MRETKEPELIQIDWRKTTDEKEWQKARILIEGFNEGIEDDPKWDFDVSFKLDYDGDIVRVSSRFYPPPKNKSGKWEGGVSILLMGKSFIDKDGFVADTIYELKPMVEEYVSQVMDKIKTVLINTIPNTYGSINNVHK